MIQGIIENQQIKDLQEVILGYFLQQNPTVVFTENQKQHFLLGRTSDLVKALGNYTLATDKLISLSCDHRLGTITIAVAFERNGETMNLNTQLISAGGDQQKFHYRYIVKGKGVKKLTINAGAAIMAQLDREQKLLSIKELEQLRDFALMKLEANKQATDEQILDYLRGGEYGRLIDQTRNESRETQEEFDQRTKEYRESQIAFWKTKNIKWLQDRINIFEKNLNKLAQSI